MRHDDSVVVLGEDVGVNGGVFRATQGLQQEFGELRVLDTPLDETTILTSVRKTGRLIVADTSHALYGFASEIAAIAVEKAFHSLRRPVVRITLPDCPLPVAHSLEQAFYPGPGQVIAAGLSMMGRKPAHLVPVASPAPAFSGPY